MAEAITDLQSPRHPRSLGTAKLLAVDAGVEGVIAAFLIIVVVASPTAEAWRRPSWLTMPVLVVVAAIFAATAVALATLARYVARSSPPRLKAGLHLLGGVNAVAASALLIWTLVDSTIGGALRVMLALGAIVVAALGAAQVAHARRFDHYHCEPASI
jgi:hypothetical protein